MYQTNSLAKTLAFNAISWVWVKPEVFTYYLSELWAIDNIVYLSLETCWDSV
jgi:hypothetical protein